MGMARASEAVGRLAGRAEAVPATLTASEPRRGAIALAALRELGLAAIPFVLFTAVLMGPVLWHLSTWLYGVSGDSQMTPAEIARRLQALQHGGIFAPLPELLGAPFPPYDPGALANPLWWYAAVPVALVLSPVGATNVLIFLSFVVTALATYAVLRYAGLAPAPSLVGATIFAFCPLHVAQAQEHAQLLDHFWFALEAGLLLALGRGARRGRVGAALGVCLGLAELDNPYLGYFALLLALAWLAVVVAWRLAHRQWPDAARLVGQGALAGAVLLALVVPTQLRPVLYLLAPGHPVLASSLPRGLADVTALSLRWWNFLLPFPENPLLGPLSRQTFAAHLNGATTTEQSVMPGYLALALAILGSSVALRRGKGRNVYAALAGVAIGVGVLAGLPPSLSLGGLALPTSTLALHVVFPEIRTVARSAWLIQLGVALLAALGVTLLLSRAATPWQRRAITAALLLGLALEYTNVPPWRSLHLLPAPGIEQWLASLPPAEAGIVVQYPIDAIDTAGNRTGKYAFYAYTLHHHPLFNGVAPASPADWLRHNLEDLWNPTTSQGWAALGVRTITVDAAYERTRFRNAGRRWPGDRAAPAGLAVRYRDPMALGYGVSAAPARIVAGVGPEFSDPELRADGREWRWLSAAGTIWLDNVSAAPATAVIWTQAHDNRVAHTLTWPGIAPIPVSPATDATAVALPITVAPGIHALPLSVSGPLLPLGGGAGAPLRSVQFRSLEPAAVRPLAARFIQAGQPRLTLTGASADACTVAPGGRVDLALLWTVAAPTDENQTVFVHLVNHAGALVAQADGLPVGGGVHTAALAPGTVLSDVHTVHLPADLPAGAYRVQVGLYAATTGARLPLAGGGDTVTLPDAVQVTARGAAGTPLPCGW